MLMTCILILSRMGARQGLAQTQIAAYDHAQRSAPPVDLVWLTWSWMCVHDIRESLRVNGLGALHLRNGSESQRPGIQAVHCHTPGPCTASIRTSGLHRVQEMEVGALLNSDMRGRDPFLNEMIELLTQRAKHVSSRIPSTGPGSVRLRSIRS